jgi:hypothetical protein
MYENFSFGSEAIMNHEHDKSEHIEQELEHIREEIEHVEEELHEGDGHHHKPHHRELEIFVNGKVKTSKEDGVTNPMSVDAIARLVGLSAETAVVRRRKGEDGHVGEPLSGQVHVECGEHFVVTRKTVEGGRA